MIKGTPNESSQWVRIDHQGIDENGYLVVFQMRFSDGPCDLHLHRHAHPHLADLAFGLFGAATSLRSAKGLLEDFAKAARQEKWKGFAAGAGITFASAAMLHEYLKTRPFEKEGYYNSDGRLIIQSVINTKDLKKYDPE